MRALSKESIEVNRFAACYGDSIRLVKTGARVERAAIGFAWAVVGLLRAAAGIKAAGSIGSASDASAFCRGG
jgi:hypothetical protein